MQSDRCQVSKQSGSKVEHTSSGTRNIFRLRSVEHEWGVVTVVKSIAGNIALGEKIQLRAVIAPERDFNLAVGEFVPEKRMVWRDGRAPTSVQQQVHVHMDETSWMEGCKRRWLWVVVSTIATLFHVKASRSGKVITIVLGAGFGGLVSSDRLKSYQVVPPQRRQLCWRT